MPLACGQRTRKFGGSCGRSDRSFLHRKMSDGIGGEPGLFDDDDPFNLPPPLPPLSPERENDTANQDGVGDQTSGDGDKKEPTKKRRVNRSPRPRLDEVRLCGDRGIPALRHLCDGIKFKGKGHEASDLKLLMQRYEYWAHRLFPKFPFVDVVEQVENLSAKKLVQNCIKRIRRGEEDTINDDERSDTEIGQNSGNQDDGPPSQEDGNPMADNLQTFGAQVDARDKMVILTPEQQERMRLNKERALAKRKATQDKRAEQLAQNELTNTQTCETETTESEDVTVEATDNGDVRDDSAENVVTENNRVQDNDVDMEDEMMDGNSMLLEDEVVKSTTTGDTATSIHVSNDKHEEVVEDEGAEMGDESEAFFTGEDIVHIGGGVPDVDNADLNGNTTDDLLESTKELPRRRDDKKPELYQTFSSSIGKVDQFDDGVLNDEPLPQNGCEETLDAHHAENPPPIPGESGLEEPQDIDMETE